jgi:hypothetical protein
MEEQKQPAYTQQYNSGNNYGPPPKTWLAESIIVTILCCQIFGVIAIIYSSQVESKHRSGDFQGAISSSATAKKLGHSSGSNWRGIDNCFCIYRGSRSNC